MNRIAVIGAGPAGITAAIQLKRYGFDPVVFERSKVGGLACNARLIENYPGFPQGITGKKFTGLMEKQAARFKVRIVYNEIVRLEWEHDSFLLLDEQNEQHNFDRLILATGTLPKDHGIKIPENCRHAIYSDITDLMDVKGKSIVIVGAGDAAFDYGLSLGKKNQVTILNRTESHKCLRLLYDRAHREPNINYLTGTTITSISTHKGLITLSVTNDKKSFSIETDFIIFAIGRKPASKLLNSLPEKLKRQLIQQKRLFTAGDLNHGMFRQVAIAAGDGLMTAMEIYNESLKQEWK